MPQPAKRFWTAATAEPEGDGWAVRLDGRPVRTPAGAPLVLPTRAMAEAAAAEWDAQEDRIRPEAMPVTRAANTVIDRIGAHREAVAEEIWRYGASDLLCYRAPYPRGLTERQAQAWDPLLDWAERRHGARMIRIAGVMHAAQPEPSLAALRAAVEAHDLYGLAALYDLTVLSGSLIIALAVAEGEVTAEEGWRLSRIDEDHQSEQWGEDAEAAATAALKRRDFLAARRLFDLLSAS